MKELFSLNPLLYRYKWRLLAGSLFVILSNFLTVYVVRYVGKAVNVINDSIEGNNDTDSVMSQFLIYGGLIILLPIVSGLFDFLKRQTIIYASRLIEYDLKNQIFKHYLNLDISFYKKNRTGDLMNRISEDVGYVRMYLGPGIMYPINLTSMAVILIVEMLLIDTTLTLYTLAPLPILSIIIYFISSKINRQSKIVQEEQSNLSSFTQDTYSGIRVIKSYLKEKPIIQTYSNLASSYKEKALKLANIQAYFFPLIILVIGLSQIFVLWAGGTRYINGDIDKIGTVAQFFMYLNMLIWPFTTLGWVSMVIQRAAASMKRINDFLNTQPAIINKMEKESKIDGKIEFDHVNFIYKNTGIQALKDVSFTLETGKSMAILGKTGSGKSTLAQLIVKLYNPTSGTIKIDNKIIDDLNLYSLRQQIGFVPQEAFLFSETIYDNIAFSVDNADKNSVTHFAKVADVHDDIMGFSEKYNTKVGERGVTLSGGQKQRISIARALIKDPTILVFDDSLSAVDTETEETILNNISTATQKKTSIIITHRVSSAKNADVILVLENGEIAERGTHEQLMRLGKLYYELYNKQIEDYSANPDLT